MNNVITLAGLDSSKLSGVDADCRTFKSLGFAVEAVISATTQQNHLGVQAIVAVSPEYIAEQLQHLCKTRKPAAIKIGMLGSLSVIEMLVNFLKNFQGWVILDPVIQASSGGNLFKGDLSNYVESLRRLLPHVDVVTPNVREAELLANQDIQSYGDVKSAVDKLLALGAKSVYLKGGHLPDRKFCQDFWTNGEQAFWLSTLRHKHQQYRATGCTLSSAITAGLAHGFRPCDAMVIAKMFTQQSIRLAKPLNSQQYALNYLGWPEGEEDLPFVSALPLHSCPQSFPTPGPIGLYPIVNSSLWVKRLLAFGVKTIQLRIKDSFSQQELQQEIYTSVQLAKQHNANLYINDHWQLALQSKAFGVHLGQEDIHEADISALLDAGLRLGLSTHSYYEVAKAHALAPSYMACGPIFATNSKAMEFAPQGVEALKRWRRSLSYPLVAIGGINELNLLQILSTGVDGAALISAITQAADPQKSTQRLLDLTQRELTHVEPL